ncbi:bifunctional 2-polyprenyl-6-hydroxyphenol methylase/3-demethylubiquinol 3-O-methyltransferase UbiG [Methylicorpusculum sp.]|uniref:class I SAM-dependent methyltransferase n=1 Tax=Methylicorpusculum sp. TaxID=2713644 RepID=UPI00271B1CD1|nr:class I SAM-dependent methyltransferase [Methylicorpusculum sp.]MDO8843246.1 class I SAM-dependent methyltransferase [Methylicorpusculum sp.]
MRELAQKLGYKLDLVDNIWINPNYKGIAYSDGDEVEKRIASIIKQALDVSVLSTELRQYCTDWPSLYHLSSTRANIMRPFKHILNTSDVLEIGAGCGAITRYIGECGANVLALEGSPRRATIARSRTRDLENVAVLTEKFDQFQCDHQFDVITLIGVLEYANLFTSGENPPLEMLKRVRSLLKPEGKLIIAIENQLGLKYFAGAPEDHLGQPMVGIEGRYRKDQPQTFGRKVLTDMLEQAGFGTSEFLAPFPDYKLPVSIVTESGFACEEFDAGALAWQSVRRDPQLPSYLAFSPELVWPIVARNGIALDLANSFLVVTNNSQQEQILAYHFSTERSSEYCKETRFLVTNTGLIELQYHMLSPDSHRVQENRLIKFSVPEKAEYVSGKLLSLELIEIVTRDGWRFEEVGAFLRRSLHISSSLASSSNLPVPVASIDTNLPGACFDLVPQNIIILHDGTYRAIDSEWQLSDDIPAGWLVFRILLLLVQSVSRFGKTVEAFPANRMMFFREAFKSAGLEISENEIRGFGNMEAAIQAEISQQPVETFLNWWSDSPLPSHGLNQAIVERNEALSLNHRLFEENKLLVAQRDEALNASLFEIAKRILLRSKR